MQLGLIIQHLYFLSLYFSESVGSTSAIYKYGAGCEQQFNEVDHVIQPSQLRGEGYDPVNGLHTIPLAILMETDNDGG